MLTDQDGDQRLGDALGRALHDRTSGLVPNPDLAESVIRRGRADRRRARMAGATAAVAALAVGGIAFADAGASGSAQSGHLRLDAYTFKLPSGAHAASAHAAAAESPACALASNGAGVVYLPGPSGGMPQGAGVTSPNQPAIANAVTANGGCVSMLLTSPYTPGAANAPSEPYPAVDQHTTQIGSYSATVRTLQFIGAGATPGTDATVNDVPIPSGTEFVDVTIHIPASGGQVQDLQISASGISEQQLASIVSSGLTATPASTTAAGSAQTSTQVNTPTSAG